MLDVCFFMFMCRSARVRAFRRLCFRQLADRFTAACIERAGRIAEMYGKQNARSVKYHKSACFD